jgi:hypothetical protein
MAVRKEQKIWIKIASSDPTIQVKEVSIRGGARATKAFSKLEKENIPFVMGPDEKSIAINYNNYKAYTICCIIFECHFFLHIHYFYLICSDMTFLFILLSSIREVTYS